MDLKGTLKIVAIIIAVILLMQLIFNFIQVLKHGKKLSRQRIAVNWILLGVLILCLGGNYYLQYHTSVHRSQSQRVAKKAPVKKPQVEESARAQTADQGIEFRSSVKLSQEGAKVSFQVPAHTSMLIIEEKSNKTLATFNNTKDEQKTLTFNFTQSGKYKIIGNQGAHSSVRELVISN